MALAAAAAVDNKPAEVTSTNVQVAPDQDAAEHYGRHYYGHGYYRPSYSHYSHYNPYGYTSHYYRPSYGHYRGRRSVDEAAPVEDVPAVEDDEQVAELTAEESGYSGWGYNRGYYHGYPSYRSYYRPSYSYGHHYYPSHSYSYRHY